MPHNGSIIIGHVLHCFYLLSLVSITSGASYASPYCYLYSRKRQLGGGYTDQYPTDWYNAALPYTKSIKMEPVATNYCYANETAMVAAAMHGQTPVYPSSSVDTYNSHHYNNYASAVPTSFEATFHQNGSSQVWQTPETSQQLSYAVPQLLTTHTVSSVSSPTNPLTPPQSGSPHSSIYEDRNLIHHSPSASPQSVHESSFQPLSLPSISGSIHLPGKYALM